MGLVAASNVFDVSLGEPGLVKRNASWVGVLGVSGAERVCVGLRRSCSSHPCRSSSFNWRFCTSATSFSTSGSELDGDIPLDICKHNVYRKLYINVMFNFNPFTTTRQNS